MPQSNVVGRGWGRVLCYTWSFKDPGSFHLVALPSFRVSESSNRSPNLTSSQGMRETASVGELRGQFYGPGLKIVFITAAHILLASLSSWPHLATGKLGNMVQQCDQRKGKWFGEKLLNLCHRNQTGTIPFQSP